MSLIFNADAVREPLYVVVPCFNPWRWKSRVKHTQRALKHFHDSGATIILVEAAFNRRELVFADSGLDGMQTNCDIIDHRFRHKYIGIRTNDELWLKENLANIGFQNAPHDWQNGAMIDSDVVFVRPNWVGECVHKLQHYAFLQMFSHARDLGPNYEMLDESYPHANGISFVKAWQDGHLQSTITPEILADLKAIGKDLKQLEKDILKLEVDLCGNHYGVLGKGHGERRVFPGLAWAFTRKAFDDVGGMFDQAIWGGGDWHMSHALIEKTEGMMRGDLHRNYKKLVMQWYHRCRTHIRMNVGMMDGSILHNWHGRKTDRGYNKKHAMLSEFGFDPLRHLKRDTHGLWQLHDDRSTTFVKLRDMMRRVAKERNEDSIDL